jgi:hypothetical protein
MNGLVDEWMDGTRNFQQQKAKPSLPELNNQSPSTNDQRSTKFQIPSNRQFA